MGKDQLGEVRGLCEGPICLPPACGPAVLSARAMRLQPGPHGCDAAGWLRARGCPGGAQPPECGFSPAGGRGHQALWHTAMSRERGDSRRGLRGGRGGGLGRGGAVGSGTMRTGPPTDGVSKGSLPQLPWQLWGCGVLPRAPAPQPLPHSSVVLRDPQLHPEPPAKPPGLQGDEAGPRSSAPTA